MENASSQPPSTPPPELAALFDARDSAEQAHAWSAFLKAHSRIMMHAARVLGSDYDAMMDRYAFAIEQLRQDDFRRLRAYVADGRGKFTTWLTVVVRRLALDHQRQRYGRPRGDAQEHSLARGTRKRLADLVGEEVDLHQLQGSSADSPETVVRIGELRQALAAGLARLAPRDRLLLALRFEDDLAAREIADVMGFPTPFHVYRRLNAILAALREQLQKKGISDAAP